MRNFVLFLGLVDILKNLSLDEFLYQFDLWSFTICSTVFLPHVGKLFKWMQKSITVIHTGQIWYMRKLNFCSIKGVLYILRASGTVYTAIDIATGQEVRQTVDRPFKRCSLFILWSSSYAQSQIPFSFFRWPSSKWTSSSSPRKS